ncbi:hypothetical protein DUI87_06202 [Hirundo rustica rustica]|uniref:Uncharacterized protein n=1 Tax=Hirundo rustica rustica TaxID=333673 RepID=A0A3M0LCV5_HIRRU|nr:hypothetical protein DUI87_06202 [Hirundo rustica rustica]
MIAQIPTTPEFRDLIRNNSGTRLGSHTWKRSGRRQIPVAHLEVFSPPEIIAFSSTVDSAAGISRRATRDPATQSERPSERERGSQDTGRFCEWGFVIGWYEFELECEREKCQ